MSFATFPPLAAAKITVKAGWLLLVALLFLAAIGFGITQTVRLNGASLCPIGEPDSDFRFCLVNIEGALPKVGRLQETVDQMRDAQDKANELARKQRVEQETRYRTIAERIETDAQNELARGLAAADRFVAANRLRSGASRNQRCDAGTPASDHRAADPAGTGQAAQLDGTGTGGSGPGAARPDTGNPAESRLTETALVAVPADDVRICTANTIKAEAGRKLATGLAAASREPVSAPEPQ